MENCKFCKLNNVVFKTKYFLFVKDNFPIHAGHHLLISRRHTRSENQIKKEEEYDYLKASKKAYEFIKNNYKKEPMIFINAPQDQSVKHFHKHYIPGVFGVLGVLKALKKILKS